MNKDYSKPYMESRSVLYFFGLLAVLLTVQCSPTTEKTIDGVEGDSSYDSPEGYDSVAYCDAYCDAYGYYQPGKWCVSQDSSVDVYCCGTELHRYCCTDPAKDVGDQYPPAKNCPNSSWWYYQWKVIVGLLGTLVVMLMFAACCYYCCGGNRQGYGRARGRFFSRGRTHPDEEQTPPDTTFDPASPYAFRPPEYSLPKDPPKYNEIINGVDNSAFDSQEPSNATSQQEGQSGSAGSAESESTSTPVVSSGSDNAPPSTNVSIAIEAPPVYEEIDSAQQSTISRNEGVSSEGDVATVHQTPSPSGRTSNTSSRHSSVTNHGSTSSTHLASSSDSLTNVENCLPPPYEEIPSTSQTSPANSPTRTVSSIDAVIETESETTDERL